MGSADLKNSLWTLAKELKSMIEPIDYVRLIMSLLCLKHISTVSNRVFKNKKPTQNSIKTNANCGIYYLPKGKRWQDIISEVTKDESIRKNIGEMFVQSLNYLMDTYSTLKGIFWTNQFLEINRHSSNILIRIIVLVDSFSKVNEKDNLWIISEIYDYFVEEFCLKHSPKQGEFITSNTVIDLIYTILDINLKSKGNVNIYDPTAGFGGMLVKSYQKLVDETSLEEVEDRVLLYGQEIRETVLRFAKVNFLTLNIPLLDASKKHVLGKDASSTITDPLHQELKFNYIFSNPPSHNKEPDISKIKNENNRFPCGILPNTNYLFLQHIVNSLTDNDENSRGACILACGTLTSKVKIEKLYRKYWVNNDLLEAILYLPDKLNINDNKPSAIWVFNKNKKENKGRILFIDLRSKNQYFEFIKRAGKKKQKIKLTGLKFIKELFLNFRNGQIINIPKTAKVVSIKKIKEKDYYLAPNWYLEYKEKSINKNELSKKRKDVLKQIDKNFVEIRLLNKELNKLEKRFSSLLTNVLKDKIDYQFHELGNLCYIISGIDFSRVKFRVTSHDTIPIWKRRNKGNEGSPRLNKALFDSKNREKILQNGVLISKFGSLDLDWKEENYYYDVSNVLLKAKNKNIVDEKYLYYYLLRKEDEVVFKNSIQGNSFRRWTCKSLSCVNLELPPIKNQEQIAKYLWNKDQILEKLKQIQHDIEILMNELKTLELKLLISIAKGG